MKILAAICLLVVGASAQVGPSGIISPDGNNVQFTHDQANNIAVVGPSGIVTKDGKNLQLTHGQATLNAAIPAPAAPVFSPLPSTLRGLVGHSGIVHPDGNTQFTHKQAQDILLIGPSGIVTKSGKNIQLRSKRHTLIGPSAMFWHGTPVQFNHAEGQLRSKLTPGQYSRAVVVGPSGAVALDGKNTQFEAPAAPTVLLEGPSGTVMSDGTLIQKRAKRSLVGPSGMIRADGTPVQFTQAEGQIRGTLTAEENARAAVVGPSGIVNFDGMNTQFDAPNAPHVILDGPSGQVYSDGSLVQKVVKRSLIGPSGMFWHGTPIQFSHAEGQLRSKLTPDQYSRAVVVGPSGAVALDGKNIQFEAPAAPTVLLEGPSGTVMSDGTLIQKRAKRSLVGPSGRVGADGILTQFAHDEATKRASLTPEENARAAVVGPSGIVNFDGKNTQFDAPAAPHVILDGPSGQVLSDGSLVQKVVKRSLPLCGPSGCILKDGTQLQLPAGVTVASAGPSGVVLSNGQNIQFS